MKTLFTNGNSWTFGSDLNSPKILAGPEETGYGRFKNYKFQLNDMSSVNDSYRIPKIWPTKLARMLDAKNVNIAWPSKNNEGICNSTIGWVSDYLAAGKNPEDLIVIVGWSDPEWKQIVMRDNDVVISGTLWPEVPNDRAYKYESLKEFSHFYVDHLNIAQEYITRYVECNFHLHIFLKKYNIKHLFFSTYWFPQTLERPHEDINLTQVIESWRDKAPINILNDVWTHDDEVTRVRRMWESIPESVFRFKSTLRSFKWYIDSSDALNGIRYAENRNHPSPESHTAWANYLKIIL